MRRYKTIALAALACTTLDASISHFGWAQTQAKPTAAAVGLVNSADSSSDTAVQEFLDVAYVADGHERQKLDLYVPRDSALRSPQGLPLIVFIHGGGWLAGDRKNPLPCPEFTRRG
ncbi:MAG: hypothetical protein KDA61_17155, partial [Planctomycetales bacterium]|nr:hypothetical protein [Planctomycetales bacterium]